MGSFVHDLALTAHLQGTTHELKVAETSEVLKIKHDIMQIAMI